MIGAIYYSELLSDIILIIPHESKKGIARYEYGFGISMINLNIQDIINMEYVLIGYV